MERLLMNQLVHWKNKKERKPLILQGARQVGKTWLLKEFGKRHYSNTAYFNFDENEDLKQFFDNTKEINRILQNLMMATGQPIKPHETLIIFDEIQECNKALNSLKYFCENHSEIHIVCAGSLLGITLSKPASFPVGKIEFLNMHPMTFSEFLMANHFHLYQYISSINFIELIPNLFFNQLEEQLKMYFVTGGFPESIDSWVSDRDTNKVQNILMNIAYAYERDFAKHSEKKDFPKISMIWRSISSQLARENKKFLYSVVKNGARAREYEDALEWLVNANLAHKIFRSTAPHLPLAAYDDLCAFKIYMNDVGLLRRVSGLAPSAFTEGDRLFAEFKGALSENYILQSLIAFFETTPRYWTSEKPKCEIDFLIQKENDIIPIEVKSGKNINSKSLTLYQEKYSENKLRIRYSMQNLDYNGNVLNIPLFLADQTHQLIDLVL